MSFTLPDLPYAKDALAPHMSAQTFDFHHGKHHQTYVTNLNNLIEGTDYAGKDLVEISKEAFAKKDMGVFNNAAQVWNHTFFWNSMTPNYAAPSGDLAAAIDKSFGSLDELKTKFTGAGATRFGSGWAWLVQKADGGLDVVSTANAEMPQLEGLKPLLTCDVWEHAYYLDYQNARPKFLEVFFDNLANWDFAAQNLAG
jgi:Fe-Mn family superoxide dismutase